MTNRGEVVRIGLAVPEFALILRAVLALARFSVTCHARVQQRSDLSNKTLEVHQE